jgi:hypothetical protein
MNLRTVLLLLLVHCAVLCTIDTSVKPLEQKTENPELSLVMQNIEQAFLDSDISAIQSLVSGRHAEEYGGIISSSLEKLAGFGNILKSREYMAGDSIHAVYRVTFEGSQFEIALAKDTGAVWKLTDF